MPHSKGFSGYSTQRGIFMAVFSGLVFFYELQRLTTRQSAVYGSSGNNVLFSHSQITANR